MSPEGIFPREKAAVEKALEIDNTLAEGEVQTAMDLSGEDPLQNSTLGSMLAQFWEITGGKVE